ncbi:hypothetical protein ACFU8Q_18730 [Streptomyces sp. NPDC057543]|uniref:hypothetical protein n=1 Tax=Streptomyces sp. NPDC057543 TaxID=3346163 RepID=UPI0036CCAA0D
MAYPLDDIGVTATAAIGLATTVASAGMVMGAITFSEVADRAEQLLPPDLQVRGAVPCEEVPTMRAAKESRSSSRTSYGRCRY